jgi:ribonuclease Z
MFDSLRVHLSEASTILHPSYMAWIKAFGPLTKHLFIGHGCSGQQNFSAFVAERLYNAKLSSLFPTICPPLLSPLQHVTPLHNLYDGLNFFGCNNLTKYHLLPIKKAGFDFTDVPSQNPTMEIVAAASTTNEISNSVEEFLRSIDPTLIQQVTETVQQQSALESSSASSAAEGIQFFFLGTGCAIPSKYRNVSSTLIYNAHKRTGIMLDCGEGTWFQLMRLIPPAYDSAMDISLAWSKILSVIWISHLHADHHLGLMSIILQRRKWLQLDNSSSFIPVFVIAPLLVLKFLDEITKDVMPELRDAFIGIPSNYFDPLDSICHACCPNIENRANHALELGVDHSVSQKKRKIDSNDGNYSDLEDAELNFPMFIGAYESLLPSIESMKNSSLELQSFKNLISFVCQHLEEELGISNLINVPVIHTIQANGLIFEMQVNASGKSLKIVYSGDTRPCETLIIWGKHADILIHEATFEDDQGEEAVAKRHSTIQEAIRVGQYMECPMVMLTHFSQRYHGIPTSFQAKNMKNNLKMTNEESEILTQETTVIVALDFMTCNTQNMHWVGSSVTPLLAEIFPATVEASEDEGADVSQKQESSKPVI